VVVDVAVSKTGELLGRWLNQFVARIEPDQQDERIHRSLADRCVSVRPDLDGMGSVSSAPRCPPLTPPRSTVCSPPSPLSPTRAIPGPCSSAADALVDVLLGRVSNGCHNRWDGDDGDSTAEDPVDDGSVEEGSGDDDVADAAVADGGGADGAADSEVADAAGDRDMVDDDRIVPDAVHDDAVDDDAASVAGEEDPPETSPTKIGTPRPTPIRPPPPRMSLPLPVRSTQLRPPMLIPMPVF